MSYMLSLLKDGEIPDKDEEGFLDCFATKILKAKYEKVDPKEVAVQQTHLRPSQREDLAHLFSKFDELFSCKLGCYPHRNLHLEITKDAKPVCQWPYRVPRMYHQVFKDKLKHLCKIGILDHCRASK